MPGPRAGQVFHPLHLVISIDHLQRNRTSNRNPFPNTAKYLDPIGFDPLPPAPPIPTLPTRQLLIDQRRVNHQTGRKAIH